MKVKNRLFFAFTLAALGVALILVTRRVQFLQTAEHARGTVRLVWARNGRSGGKSSHDVTNYYAQVEFPAGPRTQSLTVGAGQVSSHNQPVTYARYRPGDFVPVLFNPQDPSDAFRDSFGDLWGSSMMAIFLTAVFLIGSFAEPRRRTLFSPPPPTTPPTPADPPPPDQSGPKVKII